MQFVGIIPARYASTRFPGKPLVEINGISMIRRVYERAMMAKRLSGVVVATDDARIYKHVRDFGNVVYTSVDHPSGTDRCFEAATSMVETWNLSGDDVVVNIQGDEPFIHPQQINDVCDCFVNEHVHIATLIKKIDNQQQLFNENVVKVVRDIHDRALYFSRSPIPFLRDGKDTLWLEKSVYYKHIGMYAYRFNVLGQITRLSQSILEKTESLEQLRWLENGFNIHTKVTDLESHAIDTPQDLAYFEK